MEAKELSKEKPWIDISVTLKNGMVTWPDDPETSIERISDIEKGDRINLSKLRSDIEEYLSGNCATPVIIELDIPANSIA